MQRINTFTLSEVAEAAGVMKNTVYAHTDRGAIPVPSVREGRRNYYTSEEKELIISYFKSRDKFTPIGVYRGDH